jgi:hypothetical protein
MDSYLVTIIEKGVVCNERCTCTCAALMIHCVVCIIAESRIIYLMLNKKKKKKKQLLASLCGAFFSWLRFGMDNVMWISSSVSVTWTGLTMLLSRAFSSHGLSKAKEK